eukprot:scaffold1690_cov247-Pinguiococcus_pyrenoidosus.AAC.5
MSFSSSFCAHVADCSCISLGSVVALTFPTLTCTLYRLRKRRCGSPVPMSTTARMLSMRVGTRSRRRSATLLERGSFTRPLVGHHRQRHQQATQVLRCRAPLPHILETLVRSRREVRREAERGGGGSVEVLPKESGVFGGLHQREVLGELGDSLVPAEGVVVHERHLDARLERRLCHLQPQLDAPLRVERVPGAAARLHLGLEWLLDTTKVHLHVGVDLAVAGERHDALLHVGKILRTINRSDEVRSLALDDGRQRESARILQRRVQRFQPLLLLVVNDDLVARSRDGGAQQDVALDAHVGRIGVVDERQPRAVQFVVRLEVDVGGVELHRADHVVGTR